MFTLTAIFRITSLAAILAFIDWHSTIFIFLPLVVGTGAQKMQKIYKHNIQTIYKHMKCKYKMNKFTEANILKNIEKLTRHSLHVLTGSTLKIFALARLYPTNIKLISIFFFSFNVLSQALPCSFFSFSSLHFLGLSRCFIVKVCNIIIKITTISTMIIIHRVSLK